MKRTLSALAALGSILIGPASHAGFDSGNAAAVANAARQATQAALQRQAYYSVDYGNENGPYANYLDA